MTPAGLPPSPVAEVTTSYEVRWFFDGEIPDEIVEAFAGANPPGEWPPGRTDSYVPFAEDLGIKLRAEPDRPPRLEFKGRQGLDGPVSLAPGVTGRASTWIKWSYEAEGTPAALRSVLEAEESRAPIGKQRLLRRFRLQRGGPALEVGLDEHLARGVQLELTRLRFPVTGDGTREGRAWTLGLEAFPLSPGLDADVLPAVEDPLSALAAAGAALDEEHSASYPKWLLGLRTGGRGR